MIDDRMTERRKSNARANTAAWAFLITATLVSWWLGHAARNNFPAQHLAIAGVIGTALIKVWVVGLQFMELRNAPPLIRLAFAAWVVSMMVALLAIALA
ncbi:MAG TPA: cytochrome C oxidase subunit IV family protein [Beijerinckia sp.]|jgi:hypothetical protein|nr:cytochrome C oxidase subunit IV family protein [Beijerinckia sp.]